MLTHMVRLVSLTALPALMHRVVGISSCCETPTAVGASCGRHSSHCPAATGSSPVPCPQMDVESQRKSALRKAAMFPAGWYSRVSFGCLLGYHIRQLIPGVPNVSLGVLKAQPAMTYLSRSRTLSAKVLHADQLPSVAFPALRQSK